MSDIAIKVELLSKKYTIGAKASGSLRETIVHKWHSLSAKTKNNNEEFWALKDVSFEVKQGEVLGIIGKNGAGKSTLLKVLSRITEPTSGRFVINGRVSSLLEVGTGFHPELTGRENIYLNGTILGMTRKEVKLKFDEIVDFSGVEKFIDTPVKHYSSGMYVRLAFAVAAHLEPEILIIDEVLAVGDAEFQKKCLGKMDEVAKQGRTVLFVSHNMGAVKSLCKKGILLNLGEVLFIGNMSNAVEKYLQISDTQISHFIFNNSKTDIAYVTDVTIENTNGQEILNIPIGKPWQVRIRIVINEYQPHFIAGIGFITSDDSPLRTVWTKPQNIEIGIYEIIFIENNILLSYGKYRLIIGLSSREQPLFYKPNDVYITVDDIFDKEFILKNNNGYILNQMETQIIKQI